MQFRGHFSQFVLTALVFTAYAGFAAETSQAQFQDLFGQGGGRLGSAGGVDDPEVQVKLGPPSAKPGDRVTLSIQVTVPIEHYTYSTNRAFGGATRINIERLDGLIPVDKNFQPDHPPKVVTDEFLGRLEKYFDQITWSRQYQIAPNTPIERVLVKGVLEYQVCNEGSCRPLKAPFQASLTRLGDSAPQDDTIPEIGPVVSHPFNYEETPQDFTGQPQPIHFRFELAPEGAQLGEQVTLTITARIEDSWHTFALTQNPKNSGLPTRIAIENSTGLKAVGDFRPDRKPEIKTTFDGKEQRVHHGEVSWSRNYEIEASSYGIAGKIRFQLCDPKGCRNASILFALGRVADGPAAEDNLLATESGAQGTDAGDKNGEIFSKLTYRDSGQGAVRGSLPTYLLYAFLGGLILNIMPCVLPVIAIKVMSFVQQAGESRGRILALNFAYGGGVLSIFLLLAALAAFAKLGWGGLFQSSEFNLVMACLVFAMGLSLLGIFEIPVPGFVGSAAGTHQKEGLFGAFLTGIFATILATPCSGPFLGTTLGWSVQQSTAVIFLIWGTMGIGMAFPYLIFGMFPAAIKWLPKPGNWMVRLKEFAGFVLMGTVIFIISFLEKPFTIPLLIMLLGIALGAWMIGNLYDVNSNMQRKMTVRVLALLMTFGIGFLGYNLHRPGVKLPWEEFSEQRLEQATLTESRTVLIDFTADW